MKRYSLSLATLILAWMPCSSARAGVADRPAELALTPPAKAAYHSVNSSSGRFQARIYDRTGHIALAEPGLKGNSLGTLIILAPPSAKVNGAYYDFGAIRSVTNIADGIQFTQSLAGTAVTAQLTFTHDGVMHYEVTDWNGLAPTETDITAASDASEHFYGFGEKFNSLDQAGRKVHITTTDHADDKNDYSYKSSPWFLSTRGYGFHLDSTAESYFDMRHGAADRYRIQNLLGQLKFNVVAGPKLPDALERFTGYTGRPHLPPPWVFGTWVSSDIWRSGGEVRYAVTRYRQSSIPISVFVFDSPWETAYNDFHWNMTQFGAGGNYEGQFYEGFASVTAMMTFLQHNGVKVVCWMTPFVNTRSYYHSAPGQNTGQASNYAAAAANHYFVRSSAGGPPLRVPWWKGIGSPIDFTNPSAAAWLMTQLQTLLRQSDVICRNGTTAPAIGGFKTDDGGAHGPRGPYIPKTAAYFDGRTGLEMQNDYCVEYQRFVSHVLGAGGILFARSGFTGSGAYPAAWPGDNEPNYTQANGLKSVITAGNSAALSGYSLWGQDIGGYENTKFEVDRADLFTRWTEYGAFTPIMEIHRQVDSRNLEQYPWGYGTTALANYVTYADLHSQLFPYIYSYAKEASEDGLPLIRPLVLLNQTDAHVFGVQHAYYFGNELLVAPVDSPDSTSRNVRLPAGNWYDYWTSVKYPGDQDLAWSNPDTSKIPLFVREGSIIPMLADVPQTLCDPNYVNNPALKTMDSDLEFLVYPGPATANFNLYDGTTAKCATSGGSTTLTLSSRSRVVIWKILSTASPAEVQRDGSDLHRLATQNDFKAAALGWFYDADGKFLWVKFQHRDGRSTVTFRTTLSGRRRLTHEPKRYGMGNHTTDLRSQALTISPPPPRS